MGSRRVAVDASRLDDPTGVTEPMEEVLIEAFIAEAAVERLNEGVSRSGLPGEM